MLFRSNDTATTEIYTGSYTLSLHDALPISGISGRVTELRAVDEGAVPASAPVTSWLFVLPVAACRWVSADNTSELDEWREKAYHSSKLYKERTKCWHNKRIKIKQFKAGYKVLLFNSRI